MLVQTHPGSVHCLSYLIKHMKGFTNTFCSVQITGSRSQKPPVSTLVGNPCRAAEAQTSLVHPRGVRGQNRGVGAALRAGALSCLLHLRLPQTSLSGTCMEVSYLPTDKCNVPQRGAGGTGVLSTKELSCVFPLLLSFLSPLFLLRTCTTKACALDCFSRD